MRREAMCQPLGLRRVRSAYTRLVVNVTTVTAHAIATSIRSTFRCMFSRKKGSWRVAASRATIGRHAAISIGTEDHLKVCSTCMRVGAA